MKLDAKIKAALGKTSVPYEVVKTRDHYFADFSTGDRVIIAGNHGKQKHGEVVSTVQKIRRIGGKDVKTG